MAETKKTPNSNFLLLSLGCLVGFLVGFVLLLANLPTFDYSSNYEGYEAMDYQSSGTGFEFYRLLPGLNVDIAERQDEVYEPDIPRFRSRINTAQIEPVEQQKVLEVPASFTTDAYFLQAGSFSRLPDAEKMRAKLLLHGLDAFIKPFEKNGKLHHRVRLGPYYEKDNLNDARESLNSRGISYMVLRVRG